MKFNEIDGQKSKTKMSKHRVVSASAAREKLIHFLLIVQMNTEEKEAIWPIISTHNVLRPVSYTDHRDVRNKCSGGAKIENNLTVMHI